MLNNYKACQVIYKKILRLNQNGLSKISIGKVVNVMSNDVVRYNFALIVGLQGAMAPFIIGAGVYLMYQRKDTKKVT